MDVRRYLGLEVPEEPPNNYATYAIINTFYLANRSRSYLSGMAIMPLPLGVHDISNVVSAHPVLVERDLLDNCVFAIDDIYLEEMNERAEKASEDNTN